MNSKERNVTIKAYRALRVLTRTPQIRTWLLLYDPNALRQANLAAESLMEALDADSGMTPLNMCPSDNLDHLSCDHLFCYHAEATP